MNHKKINFTQIPDKTNDMIYLKSPKNLFWAISDHFWSFWPHGEKIQICHMQKTNESIQRKLTDRRKDGEKDGWIDPIL